MLELYILKFHRRQNMFIVSYGWCLCFLEVFHDKSYQYWEKNLMFTNDLKIGECPTSNDDCLVCSFQVYFVLCFVSHLPSWNSGQSITAPAIFSAKWLTLLTQTGACTCYNTKLYHYPNILHLVFRLVLWISLISI